MGIPISQPAAMKEPVLNELRSLFATQPPQSRSPTEFLVQQGALKREGEVLWVTQGVHGFVYVPCNRTHGTVQVEGLGAVKRPVVGKVASSLLFDRYRRAFRFTGKSRQVAAAWCAERVQEGTAAFAAGLKQLEGIAADMAADMDALTASGDEQGAAHLQQQRQQLLGQLAANRQQFTQAQQALDHVSQALRRSLKAFKRVRYPTIDLFLSDVDLRLRKELTEIGGYDAATAQQTSQAILAAAFKSIAHGNGLRRPRDREVWPIELGDSRRQERDQGWGMTIDCMRAIGLPFALEPHEMWPGLPPTAASAKPSIRTKGRRSFNVAFRLVPQRIRHDSIRQAFRQFLLGAWYLDERMQRHIALSPEALDALPPRSPAVEDARTEKVRQAALTALNQPMGVRDSAVAAQVEAARAAARQQIAKQRNFPLFANVPWRVDAQEAEEVRKRNCVRFANFPLNNEHRANCNSVAAALLELAAAIESQQTGEAVTVQYKGQWRSYGRKNVPKLPRPSL